MSWCCCIYLMAASSPSLPNSFRSFSKNNWIITACTIQSICFTFPPSRKFGFCYIIYLDVYLLVGVIISISSEIWLVLLWRPVTSSPGCQILGDNVIILIFVTYVIQCLEGIVLVLLCFVRLHKWPIWLNKWFVLFSYYLVFDILVLASVVFGCTISM